VSARAELFFGIIAVATVITSILQVGVLVAAGLLARRLHRAADRAEQELKPIFDHLNSIARDASRAASLATAQVERADRLFADVGVRLENTLAGVQSIVTGPVREGAALLSALRAVVNVVRDLRAARTGSRAEDEDALFI
jgi:hypothetical protein